MSQTTKTGGTVERTSITKSGLMTVRLVTVSYPGPPPEDLTYQDVDEDLFELLDRAKNAGADVDVTADHSTTPPANVTGVVSHKP